MAGVGAEGGYQVVNSAPVAVDTGQHAPDQDLSPRLFQLTILFTAASVVAALVAAAVGLWLRDRTVLAMDDLIDVTNPSYPKQIDLWVVAVWAVLTAVLSLLGLALAPFRRAAARAGGWLSAHTSVLVWLAVLAAPLLPWLTNLADAFPTAHLWGRCAPPHSWLSELPPSPSVGGGPSRQCGC